MVQVRQILHFTRKDLPWKLQIITHLRFTNYLQYFSSLGYTKRTTRYD